jgi:hypothetical protein
MLVVIMRGLPGSGKTHIAKQRYPKAVHCSTDKFFTDERGVYRFDPLKLAEYHDKNLRNFLDWVSCRGYLGDGCEVKIVHVFARPETCIARGTHNVPPEKVLAMAKSFDAVPPWWNVEWVSNEGPFVEAAK